MPVELVWALHYRQTLYRFTDLPRTPGLDEDLMSRLSDHWQNAVGADCGCQFILEGGELYFSVDGHALHDHIERLYQAMAAVLGCQHIVLVYDKDGQERCYSEKGVNMFW